MNRKIKWIATVLLFTIGLAVGVSSIPLNDRAIVIGLAIDKDGDEYKVSAQILVPISNETGTASTDITTVNEKTLSGALAKISTETGLLASLSHCSVVVLGFEVIKNDAYNVLDYLTYNSYLSENAMLLCTDGDALEILDTFVAYSDALPFFTERTIVSDADSEKLSNKTIKEFLINYYSQNKANWITIIQKKETQTKIAGGNDKSSSTQSEYVFDLSEMAIIKGNNYIFTTSGEMASGLQYVLSDLERGSITIDGDNGETIEVYILGSKKTFDYDMDTMTTSLEVGFDVKLKEILPKNGEIRNIETSELTESETSRLAKKIKKSIDELYYECAEREVDIFDIYGGFYRKYGSDWAKWKNQKKLVNYYWDVKIKIQYK